VKKKIYCAQFYFYSLFWALTFINTYISLFGLCTKWLFCNEIYALLLISSWNNNYLIFVDETVRMTEKLHLKHYNMNTRLLLLLLLLVYCQNNRSILIFSYKTENFWIIRLLPKRFQYWQFFHNPLPCFYALSFSSVNMLSGRFFSQHQLIFVTRLGRFFLFCFFVFNFLLFCWNCQLDLSPLTTSE
jgi:hypothetical protein